MAPLLSRLGLGRSGFGFGKRKVSSGSAGFSATGGNQTPANGLAPGNGYIYYTFTSPGTFTVSGEPKSMEILLVGGGGGGAPSSDSNGGGGGAGGLIYWNSIPITSGTYPITIGSGGSGGQNNGNPSIFSPGTPLHLVALGGGYAGGGPRGSMWAGNPGGSGGGGSGFDADTARGTGIQTTDPTIPANSRTYGFGTNGGQVGGYQADGGGGAGGAGSPPPGGSGGIGKQYPAFTGPLIGVPSLAPLSGYFAGGGGGGNGSAGGAGGGGSGGAIANGSPGVTNSGGGGGGSYSYQTGGTGGPGIVIIRYTV